MARRPAGPVYADNHVNDLFPSLVLHYPIGSQGWIAPLSRHWPAAPQICDKILYALAIIEQELHINKLHSYI